MKRELSAVIFDMDGVLIDSAEDHFQSWRRLAADWGTDVTREQFKTTFGRQNRDIVPILLPQACKVRDVTELGEIKERYYRDLIGEHLTLLPGAAELVSACNADGLTCAVGSSGHPENIAIALSALGVDDIIQAVVSGHDVTTGKPNPEVFLKAAERIGVAPSRCAVIEDAPAGIEAALAAGMVAIAVTTEHPAEKLAHAHLVVSGMPDLSPGLIRKAAGNV